MREVISAVILNRLSIYNGSCVKGLVKRYGSLDVVLELSLKELDRGVRDLLGDKLLSIGSLIEWGEQEVEWCRNKGVEILIKGERGYPTLLNECEDAPLMLYYKGSLELTNECCLSMVGTRLASNYGREMCATIIKGLVNRGHRPTIVSGLAYGIDIAAHRAALEYGLNSIAVVPCGIDTIYPTSHRGVAKELIKHGGIITEFPRGVKPLKYNFIRRNRVIAGVSEGVVLVESRIKGGAMITVELANSYGRDIFAVPARVTDINSYGANYLISKSVASIYCNETTIPNALQWESTQWGAGVAFQQQLFTMESSEKERVLQLLIINGELSTDDIMERLKMSLESMSMVLLELELEGSIILKDGFYSVKG